MRAYDADAARTRAPIERALPATDVVPEVQQRRPVLSSPSHCAFSSFFSFLYDSPARKSPSALHSDMRLSAAAIRLVGLPRTPACLLPRASGPLRRALASAPPSSPPLSAASSAVAAADAAPRVASASPLPLRDGGEAPPESWVPALRLCVPGHSSASDPFHLVAGDLEVVTRSIRDTVSVLQHPTLDKAVTHLFSLKGKRIRPLLVLLMAHATAALHAVPPSPVNSPPSSFASVAPHPHHAEADSSSSSHSPRSSSSSHSAPPALLPSQLRLAEIAELIHAASLLHDDVIDVADTRRGALSVNSLFGNQLAVLAGDFLLSRASVALARLRDCDVIELLSTVIEHLVRGEVLQMRGAHVTAVRDRPPSSSSSFSSSTADAAGERDATATGASARFASLQERHALSGGIGDASERSGAGAWYLRPTTPFDSYLAKTFFKTASLVANSCRAVTMLAGHSSEVADVAYRFGEDVGMAFQLVDDVLDMTGDAASLGKPVLNDMRQGVATAPVLFAMQEFPDDVGDAIARRFSGDGDIERVAALVERTGGIEKTRELATTHVRRAIESVAAALPPSDHRSALINLANFVIMRER